MSEMLLLDWDDHRARVLGVKTAGSGVRVEYAAARAIDGDPSVNTIVAALKPMLADYHGNKSKALVVLGGRDVQSRLLRVPPVPSEELPDVVRLRAGTEFPTVDDTAIVDFLPLESTNGQPTTVLAARVAEKVLAKACEVCAQLQITPQHVTMRGGGVAAQAMVGEAELQSGVHLIVVRRGDELDLVGTWEGKAAVVRTVPMPVDADLSKLADSASREIRRTIAAVSSELGVSNVGTVMWGVASEEDKSLADRCGRELSRRISLFDITTSGSSDVNWPEHAAAFAGMIGTATGATSRKLPIDFLAPRKPLEKSAPITTYALAGTLAAVVLLGGGWMMYSGVASLEKAAAADMEERKEVEADIEKLAPERAQSQDIDQWLATDVNWLDEIDRIATTIRPEPLDNHESFKPDEDVLLTSLLAKQATGKRGVGGVVELAGGVREDAVLEDIENRLRKSSRQVNPKTMVKETANAPYVWAFKNDVVVTPVLEERQ